MPKLGHFSGTEVCRILEQHGFNMVRQRGSHAVMQKRDGISTVTVPVPTHQKCVWNVVVNHSPARRAEVGI